jgi:hypothetical protein
MEPTTRVTATWTTSRILAIRDLFDQTLDRPLSWCLHRIREQGREPEQGTRAIPGGPAGRSGQQGETLCAGQRQRASASVTSRQVVAIGAIASPPSGGVCGPRYEGPHHPLVRASSSLCRGLPRADTSVLPTRCCPLALALSVFSVSSVVHQVLDPECLTTDSTEATDGNRTSLPSARTISWYHCCTERCSTPAPTCQKTPPPGPYSRCKPVGCRGRREAGGAAAGQGPAFAIARHFRCSTTRGISRQTRYAGWERWGRALRRPRRRRFRAGIHAAPAKDRPARVDAQAGTGRATAGGNHQCRRLHFFPAAITERRLRRLAVWTGGPCP